MIIKELFVKTTRIFSCNMVLTQPLLIFLLIIGIFLSPISSGVVMPAILFLLVAVMAAYSAFLSGWFNMFRKSIDIHDKTSMTNEEKAEFSLNLFKEFFPGVGKYFHKMALSIIIYAVLYFIIINIAAIVGKYFIGIPKSFPVNELMTAMSNEAKAIAFINNISPENKLILSKWYFLYIIFSSVYMYLTMFWAQALILADKSPIYAFIESVKTVLKRPFITFAIFICNWLSLMIISTFNSLFGKNLILHFIGLVLFIFTIVYFTIMAFLYFEKFRENNCCSRTDSFR